MLVPTSSKARRWVGVGSARRAWVGGPARWQVLRVSVARCSSRVWKEETGWWSGVALLAALALAWGDGVAGATGSGRAGPGRSVSVKVIGARARRKCQVR